MKRNFFLYGLIFALILAFTIIYTFKLYFNYKLSVFKLDFLPMKKQQEYLILIMIPIGALIIVFLKNIIGIYTLGTFMPILIAIAFQETGLIFGVLSFSIIILLGIVIRYGLEYLQILTIPRLACMLSIIILIILSITTISNNLHYQHSFALSLFPIVIITMTIERIIIILEERGPLICFYQYIGSIISSCLAYTFMNNYWLKTIFFANPEVILLLIAIMLLIGNYRGFRCIELFKFRELIKVIRV